MSSLQWAARKIGLGLRPDDAIDISVDDWIEAQLGNSFPRLCIETVYDVENPPIVEWPAALTFSLRERIERSIAWRNLRLERESAALDPVEDERRRAEETMRFSVNEIDQYRFANAAVYSADQLKLRLMHFWLNHFTVGWKDVTPQLIGDYLEAIYSSLDGSFVDLVYRVTTHPAMLTYLDNVSNIGLNSDKAGGCDFEGCVIGFNDNLARELMELHTVSPARGYTESDIREAAEVLTGWGELFEAEWQVVPDDWAQPWAQYHAEPGTKTVLGTEIPEGRGGLRVLTDMLAADPLSARFISGKLARHFIGDGATDEDISAIESAWMESGGDLPTIHRAVIQRALASPAKRYHWPLTWAFQLLRMSGATLLRGYADVHKPLMEGVTRDPDHLMSELGNSFWSIRQPNGFSDLRSDWISTEHLDRRLRFAALVFNHGNIALSVEEIMDRHGFSDTTRQLVEQGQTPLRRFLLLACSPEMMEV